MIVYENVTATDKPEFTSLQRVYYRACPEHLYYDAESLCVFIHDEDFVEERRSLDYKEYLKSHYWQLVRSVKLSQEDKCSVCGKKKGLNIHHKTYEHRGEELIHLNDLIVLCRECHKKFHEIGK